MDGQTLVQLISAIAWPLTVIIIALMFRQEIRKTANRFSTFSYGDKEAWRDIEVTTKQVINAYGISTDGQIAGVKAIRELVHQHLLPESVVSVYEQMRRLRSRAAHAADFTITPDEAKRYIDTAYRFHNTLLFLLQQAKKPSSLKRGG
jgi:hypothetical protein